MGLFIKSERKLIMVALFPQARFSCYVIKTFWHDVAEDFVTASTGFMYIFKGKKALDKSRNKKTMLRFKSRFICQHRKTILRSEF